MSGKRRATGGTRSEPVRPRGSVSHRATPGPQVSLTDPRIGQAGPPLGPSASAQAAVPGQTVAPGGFRAPASRRDEREARKQQSRRRRRVLTLVAAIVVGIVAVGLLVPALFMDRHGGSTAVAPARTQQTLAMVVATPGSPVLAGSLSAYDSDSASGSMVLVPSRLIVEGPSPDGVPFGTTAQMASPDAPGFALAQTLGVVVDGTWSLTPQGLASLVDSVGGVPVTVQSDVVVRAPDGSSQVVVPAGTTRLTGAQAAAYATVIPAGADEQVRLAHYDEVMMALLPRLTTDPAQLEQQLADLGGQSSVTTGDAWLARYLIDLGQGVKNDDVLSQTLPVKPLDVGGSTTAYTLDEPAAQQLVDQQFAGSKPPGGSTRPRVLVQNGVGTAGLVDSAAGRLTDGGFAFVNGGNANRFGYKKSIVIVPDASPGSTQLGAEVARALGLPASVVRISPQGQTVADVVVILGPDYEP